MIEEQTVANNATVVIWRELNQQNVVVFGNFASVWNFLDLFWTAEIYRTSVY